MAYGFTESKEKADGLVYVKNDGASTALLQMDPSVTGAKEGMLMTPGGGQDAYTWMQDQNVIYFYVNFDYTRHRSYFTLIGGINNDEADTEDGMWITSVALMSADGTEKGYSNIWIKRKYEEGQYRYYVRASMEVWSFSESHSMSCTVRCGNLSLG